MEYLFSVLITILLVLINGYFAMSEMALINARRSILQQTIDEGTKDQSKKAQRAVDLAQNSDRLLATIQIAITLVGFGASALAATSFSAPIVAWLQGFDLPWLSAIANGLAVVVITLIISYVSLVIGELVPKRIALSNAENVAMSVSGPIGIFERVAGPLVTMLSASTNGISRLFGIKSVEDRQTVSEDEIKYLVNEHDDLLDEEKRMISEIFDLGDTVARMVMTPRVDMICIEDEATVRQTISRVRGTGFSRIPVFHDTPDRIVGIAMVKDLLDPLMDDKHDELITNYMREPLFVPETKDILPLLGELQTSHQQIVIVVDEYGGTAGIVTIEDIVEEIVGDISDEHDSVKKYQTQLSDTEWLIDGRMSADDAREFGFPVEDAEDYETIAGWLFDTIDSVPCVGDVYEIGGYSFKVQKMRRNRIAMLRVGKLEQEETTSENAETEEQKGDLNDR
jgi:putative hemolysin